MPPVVSHKNNQIYVDLQPLVEQAIERTYLTADSAAADTTLAVKDIDGFGTSDYLILGELGSEAAELVKVHASTAPSGTTITLITGGTEFAHSAGTKVYRVRFNQIEFSHASTAGGSKSVLATQDVQVDGLQHVYTDTTQSSGFYFARFKDETGSTFGSYSDAIPYGGWASNTVGHMIEQALRNNKIDFTDDISRTDCYDIINEGLRLVQGKQIRYPQHQNLNAIIGQTSRGTNIVSLPTDIYDNDTNKSIMGVRVGEKENLEFLDPDEFEQALADTTVTQVRTEASANDTTLALDNSYDFDDSGSVNVYISGTKHNITYTGVTRDDADGGTAVLTGVPASGDGAITVTIPVDTYVWQDELEGEPQQYTIRNGNLEFWPLANARNDNKNIRMDYFTVATEVDSDGDEIDMQRYDMLQDYLTWRVKMRVKNNGILDLSDGWYIMFKERLNDAIRTSRSVFTHKMMPKVNRIAYRAPFANRYRNTREDD